jgi:hypothetical protein
MTTSSDLIRRALKLAGVVATEDAVPADQAEDALVVLNEMLQTWASQPLLAMPWTQVSKALTAGVQTYTIGAGGDINTPRPVSLYHAHVNYGGIDYTLSVGALEEYEENSLKAVGGVPASIYIRPGYPLSTVILYPYPSDSSMTLVLDTVAPPVDLALSTTLPYPSNWLRAIRYNLALEICAEYGADPSAVIVKIAKDSLHTLMTANHQLPTAKFDPLLVGGTTDSSLAKILRG